MMHGLFLCTTLFPFAALKLDLKSAKKNPKLHKLQLAYN